MYLSLTPEQQHQAMELMRSSERSPVAPVLASDESQVVAMLKKLDSDEWDTLNRKMSNLNDIKLPIAYQYSSSERQNFVDLARKVSAETSVELQSLIPQNIDETDDKMAKIQLILNNATVQKEAKWATPTEAISAAGFGYPQSL